jgi:NADH:ubiquinone reductase (H+-translocating)
MKTQILVLGAGYAGVMAANRAAAKTDAQVTLINASDRFVERIRLHQQAAGQAIKERSLRSMLNRKIKFVQGMVTALHPEANEVDVQTTAGEVRYSYDYLVYALGSYVDMDRVSGVREYADTFNPNRVQQLHQRVQNAEQLVIIGGGLTAIEGATEFAERYPNLKISVVTRGRLGEGLSEVGVNYLYRTFNRLGIKLYEYTDVSRIERGVVVTQGVITQIPYDVVIWAGAFGVPQLAKEGGIGTNSMGQLLIDSTMRSVSHPNIFAAGDSSYLVDQTPVRMSCATALPTGAKAADNLIALLNGEPLTDFQFGYVIQCISLGRSNGLIQMVNPDDTARNKIITGKSAAFFKEQICRFTVWSLIQDRYLPGSFQYPKSDKSRAKLEVEHGRI